jgi:hypothetical protein
MANTAEFFAPSSIAPRSLGKPNPTQRKPRQNAKNKRSGPA